MRAGGRFEVRVEKRVHQRAFTQTSFAHAQDVENESVLNAFVDQLVRKTIEPNMARKLQVAQMVLVLSAKEIKREIIELYSINIQNAFDLFMKTSSEAE